MKAIWFRSDLRTLDNPALYYALQQAAQTTGEGVVGIFCATTLQWKQHHMADAQAFFIKESLYKLQQSLIKLRVPLVVLDTANFSQVPQALLKFCKEHHIRHVYSNREYEWNERLRDQQSQTLLNQHNIETLWFDDQCLLAPGTVFKPDGNPYTVFTPFSKRWKQIYNQQPITPLPEPQPQAAFQFEVPDWPKRMQSLSPVAANQYWEGGEAAAQRALEAFIQKPIRGYHENRDRPDWDQTSRLSPHLAIGTISANQCLMQALEYQKGDIMLTQTGSSVWINELIWRDFYKHLLIHFPRVSKNRAFKASTEQLAWRQSKTDFTAWTQGLTGIPIVDAAMRQLNTTGWMHNRLRMITAMFLTKHLLIDWRKGETYFMEQLIDGDLAANNGGWQWSASTGTDAAPYFRIFNPITQSQKFDPTGDFIRKYVPELRTLNEKEIHDPSSSQRHNLGYPEMIVDLKQGRERALAAFKALDKGAA